MACGERHNLTSGILDHQIKLSSYKRIMLNDEHACAVERWHEAVFFHGVVLRFSDEMPE